MARFFQSLDDEKAEIKKKTISITNEEPEIKISKSEKKLKELESKIAELNSSNKNFEKLFKKFIGELKKYENFYENLKIPDFVLEFLADERILKSKQMSALASAYIDSINSNTKSLNSNIDNINSNIENHSINIKSINTKSLNTKSLKKNILPLENILEIESTTEKEQQLINYSTNSPEEKCAIAIALFSIYFKNKDSLSMIQILSNSANALSEDNSFSRNFIKNLDFYIGKIYSCLDSNFHKEYLNMLNSLSFLNSSIINFRILEYSFFILKEAPETDDPIFKLLFLIRNKKFSEAKLYYNQNRCIFNDTQNISTVISKIIYEYALLSAENYDFLGAFDSFVYCQQHGLGSFKIQIYALCVILNFKIKENAAFINFIEDFKRFDSNILVLKSENPIFEIFRAFYLFNMLDYSEAAKIIECLCGFACESILKESIPV